MPSSKTNVTPTPPGGGGTGVPNSFFCYKAKCPVATLPTFSGADQFGSRTVTPSAGRLLCAPLAGPSTTTATTSTTTTTLRFVDNGDGTVTDHQTGLTWEKKTGTIGTTVTCGQACGGAACADPHDVNNIYSWSTSGIAPDGCAFTDFLARLNYCTSADGHAVAGGFAGHCDWRLPTSAELEAIEDMSGCASGSPPPCIDTSFGPPAPARRRARAAARRPTQSSSRPTTGRQSP